MGKSHFSCRFPHWMGKSCWVVPKEIHVKRFWWTINMISPRHEVFCCYYMLILLVLCVASWVVSLNEKGTLNRESTLMVQWKKNSTAKTTVKKKRRPNTASLPDNAIESEMVWHWFCGETVLQPTTSSIQISFTSWQPQHPMQHGHHWLARKPDGAQLPITSISWRWI